MAKATRSVGTGGGEALRGRVRSLGHALQPVMRPLLRGRPLAEAQLLLDWPEVVGARFAALCRPLKVRFQHRGERRGGVLELACSGPAALELQHASPQIIQRVNAFLGYPAVARLALKQVLSEPAPLAPVEAPQGVPAPAPGRGAGAPEEESESRLERALAGLGEAVAARRRRASRK